MTEVIDVIVLCVGPRWWCAGPRWRKSVWLVRGSTEAGARWRCSVWLVRGSTGASERSVVLVHGVSTVTQFRGGAGGTVVLCRSSGGVHGDAVPCRRIAGIKAGERL